MFAGLMDRPDGAHVRGHEKKVMKDATEHAMQRFGVVTPSSTLKYRQQAKVNSN